MTHKAGDKNSKRVIVLYVFPSVAKQSVYIISQTLVILFRIYHWRTQREMMPTEPNLKKVDVVQSEVQHLLISLYELWSSVTVN
jgi:hypothetical protein